MTAASSASTVTQTSPAAVVQPAVPAVSDSEHSITVAPGVGLRTGVRTSSSRRSHIRRLVLLADGVGAALAGAASVSVLFWEHAAGDAGDRLLLLGAVLVALAGPLALRGTRRSQIAPRVADDLGSIVSSLAVAGLFLFALRSVPALGDVIRPSSIGVALGVAVLCVPAARGLGMVLAAHNPANVARVVVVGSGFIAGYLTARLARSPLVNVLGIVDDRPGGTQRVLGRFEDLPRLCAALRVDRVIIAFSERHPARTAEVVHAVRSVAEVDVVVRFFEVTGWESRLTDVTGLPLLSLGPTPGPAGRAAKRAIDVVVSSVSLALLSPVLLAVALAVRVESGAPVLFRQERVGRGQRAFHILKFRTMRPEEPGAPPRPAAALHGSTAMRTPFDSVPDPARITRVGSFLRRTGIDELPQLLNVLRGEMSLVGPRPFIPEECEALSGTVARRFDVRPGMTGMWQVCGQHELTFEELVRLDVQYATSWCLRSDLRILARTPGRLLHGSAPGR